MPKMIDLDLTGKKKAKRNLKKGLALGTAAGAVVGAAAGILFAPKPGKETREDVKNVVSTTAKKVAEEVKDAAVIVNQKVSENAKKIVKRYKNVEDEEVIEESVQADADKAQEV